MKIDFRPAFMKDFDGCWTVINEAREQMDAVFASVPDFDKSKAVMIGDSLSSDIRGGINAGITTIWYNPHLKRNDLGVCPDYTATSYEQVLRILHSETGRVPPHVSV